MGGAVAGHNGRMAEKIPPSVFQRLQEYRAATFFNDRGPQASAIRAEFARITDEKIRQGAMDRFHILMVCMSVMRMDPGNYQRAVNKAFEQLISYLENAGRSTAPAAPLRSAPPPPTVSPLPPPGLSPARSEVLL
jgi:hypothetical protein